MSDFAPGFASRHDSAGDALQRAFGVLPDFAPHDIGASARDRAPAPKHFSPEAAGPQHFAPADRKQNPTQGWDPFNPDVSQDDAAGQFTDPVAAAKEAGIAEGRAQAFAEMATANDRDQQLLMELRAALGERSHFDRDTFARHLRQAVVHLVTRIVGEVGVEGELLTRRIEAAAELLADSAESAMLRLHPDDVPLVEGALPKTVFPVGDSNIARGSFALESASTVVEDGPDLWLEQLGAALDRVAVPPAC
ncbi:FliH/SctL family protein [Stakelama marina]|uniref:Flagellar biosynthesis protein FliH n=1 Tax=Stakelama marina TaxID=2826939 RepID=A0A8T4IGH1_9SPHN|nr:FliH/SctL family protein [Stakelama marina]MBR0553132.1 flagellar biosynthesis protein FliH [Stakelama marina]